MARIVLLLLAISSLHAYLPWYTGPLITTGAVNEPPGQSSFQPYFYYQTDYGSYGNNWAFSGEKNITSVYFQPYYQLGLFPHVDLTVIPQLTYSTRGGAKRYGLSDAFFQLGFQLALNKKDTWVPDVRLTANLTTPNGKWDNLNPQLGGMDAMGGGSYNIGSTLIIRKWFFMPGHPMRVNLNVSYNYLLNTNVQNQSIYGGGRGTHGKIFPGSVLATNLSFEYSVTQRWVLCFENIYSHQFKSRFKGETAGNSLRLGHIDQLSFVPEIEYNINENYGWIGGLWFTAAGRNSSAFINAVLSFYMQY